MSTKDAEGAEEGREDLLQSLVEFTIVPLKEILSLCLQSCKFLLCSDLLLSDLQKFAVGVNLSPLESLHSVHDLFWRLQLEHFSKFCKHRFHVTERLKEVSLSNDQQKKEEKEEGK